MTFVTPTGYNPSDLDSSPRSKATSAFPQPNIMTIPGQSGEMFNNAVAGPSGTASSSRRTSKEDLYVDPAFLPLRTRMHKTRCDTNPSLDPGLFRHLPHRQTRLLSRSRIRQNSFTPITHGAGPSHLSGSMSFPPCPPFKCPMERHILRIVQSGV
jgi:hypothetical protein